MSGGYIPQVHEYGAFNELDYSPEDYPYLIRDLKYKLLDPSLSKRERDAIRLQINKASLLVPSQLQYLVDRDATNLRHGRQLARELSREVVNSGKKDLASAIVRKKAIREQRRRDLLVERARREELKQELSEVNQNISDLRASKKYSRANNIMWRMIVDYPSDDYYHDSADIFNTRAPPRGVIPRITRRHTVPSRPPPKIPRSRPMRPPPIPSGRHAVPSRSLPPTPDALDDVEGELPVESTFLKSTDSYRFTADTQQIKDLIDNLPENVARAMYNWAR